MKLKVKLSETYKQKQEEKQGKMVGELFYDKLSPSFLWLSRTLCEIKHGSTAFLEKRK